MGFLNEQFDDLFHDTHEKLNEILYKVIKEYGEDKGDYLYLDTLELRLFYDGERTRVTEYEYIVNEEDSINEPKWEEDSSGNLKRYINVIKNEYLDKINEYIFENQSLDKKVNILTEILR